MEHQDSVENTLELEIRYKRWRQELDHFLDKAYLKHSFLDNRAIRFLNDGFTLKTMKNVILGTSDIPNGSQDKRQCYMCRQYTEKTILANPDHPNPMWLCVACNSKFAIDEGAGQ